MMQERDQKTIIESQVSYESFGYGKELLPN